MTGRWITPRRVVLYVVVAVVLIVLVTVVLSYHWKASDNRAGARLPGSGTPTGTPQPTGSPGRLGFVLPDHSLTPGAVHGTNLADICPRVLPVIERARPSQAVKERVYAAYHITSRAPGQYEIDHLIPLELDGANSAANLWPEPNDHPNASAFGHGVLNSKDLLENKLHALVCAGTVPLAQAQHEIATDWMVAYVRYLGPPPTR